MVGIRLQIHGKTTTGVLEPTFNCRYPTDSTGAWFQTTDSLPDIFHFHGNTANTSISSASNSAPTTVAEPAALDPSLENLATNIRNTGASPSMIELVGVQITIRQHGEDDLHWFHNSLNSYYEHLIQSEELKSLTSEIMFWFPNSSNISRFWYSSYSNRICRVWETNHFLTFCTSVIMFWFPTSSCIN